MSAQETVAKVAAFKDGKVLMGLRRDDKKWCFPGGHLDAGESAVDGARRELEEETGLKATKLRSLGTRVVKDGAVKVHAFSADVDDEPDGVGDPDAEFSRFRWVNPKAMPDEVMENLHSKPDVLLQLLGTGATSWSKLSEAA